MKSKAHWLLILTILVLCVTAWAGYAQKQRSVGTTWEYKVLDFRLERTENIEKTLGSLGAQGWELVAVQSDGTISGTYFFKRAKS